MLNSLLRRLLAPAPAPLAAPEASLAFAALLVRLARTDGLYAHEEVERIEALRGERLGVDPFEAARLRAEAEAVEAEAPDTVRFTRALKEATPLEERSALVQALWSVVLSDGTRDAGEDQEMRLLSRLLGLSDVESAQARQRAERA